MNVEHRLARAGTVVDDHPVSFRVQASILGDLLRRQEQMADKPPVFFGHAVNFRNMAFRNNEEMNGGLRVYVFKGDHEVVFINDF